tara:strand:- start:3095 stop:3649 length:555 start_codon:yes stop_codon:yes gene_type:complete
MELPREFVIYDTEYTTWKGAWERGWSGPGEEKELVQIGVIRVRDLEETDSLLLYVQPRINPVLSDYFKELTRITQEEVDTQGVRFEAAYTTVMDWASDLPMYSYGPDHEVLRINHELYKTGTVIPEKQFNDVREHFAATGVDTSKYMSSTIPKAYGLIPPLAGHDALNDARSILMALKAVYTTE